MSKFLNSNVLQTVILIFLRKWSKMLQKRGEWGLNFVLLLTSRERCCAIREIESVALCSADEACGLSAILAVKQTEGLPNFFL